MYIYTKKKAPTQKKRNKSARLRAALRKKNERRRVRMSKGCKW
jgi:hypothetical protein